MAALWEMYVVALKEMNLDFVQVEQTAIKKVEYLGEKMGHDSAGSQDFSPVETLVEKQVAFSVILWVECWDRIGVDEQACGKAAEKAAGLEIAKVVQMVDMTVDGSVALLENRLVVWKVCLMESKQAAWLVFQKVYLMAELLDCPLEREQAACQGSYMAERLVILKAVRLVEWKVVDKD